MSSAELPSLPSEEGDSGAERSRVAPFWPREADAQQRMERYARKRISMASAPGLVVALQGFSGRGSISDDEYDDVLAEAWNVLFGEDKSFSRDAPTHDQQGKALTETHALGLGAIIWAWQALTVFKRRLKALGPPPEEVEDKADNRDISWPDVRQLLAQYAHIRLVDDDAAELSDLDAASGLCRALAEAEPGRASSRADLLQAWFTTHDLEQAAQALVTGSATPEPAEATFVRLTFLQRRKPALWALAAAVTAAEQCQDMARWTEEVVAELAKPGSHDGVFSDPYRVVHDPASQVARLLARAHAHQVDHLAEQIAEDLHDVIPEPANAQQWSADELCHLVASRSVAHLAFGTVEGTRGFGFLTREWAEVTAELNAREAVRPRARNTVEARYSRMVRRFTHAEPPRSLPTWFTILTDPPPVVPPGTG